LVFTEGWDVDRLIQHQSAIDFSINLLLNSLLFMGSGSWR